MLLLLNWALESRITFFHFFHYCFTWPHCSRSRDFLLLFSIDLQVYYFQVEIKVHLPCIRAEHESCSIRYDCIYAGVKLAPIKVRWNVNLIFRSKHLHYHVCFWHIRRWSECYWNLIISPLKNVPFYAEFGICVFYYDD